MSTNFHISLLLPQWQKELRTGKYHLLLKKSNRPGKTTFAYTLTKNEAMVVVIMCSKVEFKYKFTWS